MNNLEKKLKAYSDEIREAYVLKKEERVRIVDDIFSRTQSNSHNNTHIPSPYRKINSPYFFFMNYTSTTLLFLFVITGVLSYVAEGALPGDPLYSVKTQVIENMQTLLTVSPESKAKLQTTLAKKRVEEAEKLVASDRLSVGTGAALAVNFNKHLDDFQQFVDEVIVSESLNGTTTTINNVSLMAIDATLSQRITAYNSLKDISKAVGSLSNISTFSSSTVKFSISTSTKTILFVATSSTSSILFQEDVASSTATSTVYDKGYVRFSIENRIVNFQSVVNDGIDMFKQNDYTNAQLKFDEALNEIKELKEIIKTVPLVFVIDSNQLLSVDTSLIATSTVIITENK